MLEDKRPLQSKKFVAYLVAEATWKLVVVLLILAGREALPTSLFVLLLAVVLIAGFIEVGYILSAAALDKYTRLAQIVSNGGGNNGSVAKLVSKGTRGLIDLEGTAEAPRKDKPDNSDEDRG